MFDVITVGSAVLDIFAKTDSEILNCTDCDSPLNKYLAFPLGAKLLIKESSRATGGGATNTAVAISRLGLKVGCVSKVGCDYTGRHILDELEAEHVSFLGFKCEGTTAYSLVLMGSGSSDRTILTDKGITNELTYSEIPKKQLNAKWFYFCTLLGTAFKTMQELAVYAEKKKINVAFNPTTYLIKGNRAALKRVLRVTDMLFLNTDEARLLTGKESIDDVLKACFKLVPHLVVVTDGKRGAYCYDGTTRYFIKPRNVKVVETTGAGDAFTSSFLTAFIKSNSIEDALCIAQVNAESVVQHHGAKQRLLTWDEACKESKKAKYKITQKLL